MATLEKGPASERSFAHEVGQRVILRLAGTPELPLEHSGALRLDRLLHGEKKKSDYRVGFNAGKYYIEFTGDVQDDETPLTHAISETDTALDKGSLLAEVEAAWEVPAEAPSFDRLTPQVLEQMPEVTVAARSIFVEHHAQLVERNLQQILYEVA
jgi:hypothetical protein